jgi:hypothetical protein
VNHNIFEIYATIEAAGVIFIEENDEEIGITLTPSRRLSC